MKIRVIVIMAAVVFALIAGIVGYNIGLGQSRHIIEQHGRIGEILSDELNRLQQLQTISTGELERWVAQNQRINDLTLQISADLASQVQSESRAGVWVILLVIAAIFVVLAVWLVWEIRINRKAETTLQNFQRIVMLHLERQDAPALEDQRPIQSLTHEPT